MEKMKVTNRLIAIFTILLFAGNILTILPVSATVGGALTIMLPDTVASGGPILVDTTAMTATGGTMYFYLSLNDDPEISSGDIYFASAKTVDAVAEAQTLFLTASVSAEEYYVKGVDIKGVGKACVVTDNTIVVIDEGLPTATNNDPTGNVGDEPEIEIKDAGDWETVTVDWKAFTELGLGDFAIVDDEVVIDTFMIPNAYKGTYKIILLFTGVDADSYATYVEFSVTPDVAFDLPSGPDGLSIEADELDQVFTIHGTGFPEGTVAGDSITMTLKNFMTGSTIDNYETRHDEVDIGDGDLLEEGVLEVDVTVDAVEAGVLDLKVTVDSTATTFEAAIYSSTPTAEEDFAVITHYKISETSGQNGDEVTFSFINLPATADVTIRWIGETVTTDVAGDLADLFGAYEADYDLFELPGGAYSVRAIVTTGATTRERTIATFTVLPRFEVRETGTEDVQDEAVVGELVDLYGDGFPADASIQTSFFGTEENDFDDINVLATGDFTVVGVEIPHVSGGGKAVTVKVEGEDADGDAINAQSTIIINPQLVFEESSAIEFNDGISAWETLDTLPIIFPGHILKLIGNGFLTGETLTVKLYDDADKLIGSAVVGDGEKADGDGDIELVAWLPNAKVLYPAGKLDCYLTVAGSTATNEADLDAFDVSASDDATAFILNGIANDGDDDNEVVVGDTLRVIGFGFRTKSIDLTIDTPDETDIKTVSSVNGFFDTTFTIPELQGSPEPDVIGDFGHYHVDALDAWSCFFVYPKITLSPATGFVDSKFTVSGTGFEDGVQDFDITWVGIIGDEVLETVDMDDVEDGSFTIEVTVPTVVPQSYKVEAVGVDDEEMWDDTVYTVADKAAVQQNKTLTEILAQLKSVDFAALKTQVAGAQTTAAAAQTAAQAAQTTAAAAQTAANAAKTSADAAKTSADTAGSKADAAKTAADAAKTAADNAASSANGLTTLVYGAIGASLVAALAAIVALMQISRKIA